MQKRRHFKFSSGWQFLHFTYSVQKLGKNVYIKIKDQNALHIKIADRALKHTEEKKKISSSFEIQLKFYVRSVGLSNHFPKGFSENCG